ncbi:MAG: hypothetical protein SFX73_36575 [Kofleriaceae bacterium]|nr:hypothetical protein [Kofleriaceae bacterium]
MKRFAAALACLLIAAPALAATYSGGGVGTPSAGTAVAAALDFRSFGQTGSASAGSPGTLNVKYGEPVWFWACDTTVNGTAINCTNWVPETFVSWDFDDTSLGTVSRGGRTVDLGKAVGLIATHAFKPSTFAETCNGGTNSLHAVSGRIDSLVGGSRATGTVTVNVCVEKPATTYGNPIAYCDDANCADDAGVPAGATHGGNGTDLATILNSCDAAPKWIVLEGGVTFSTGSTGITMGANKCLIQSYGSGRAKLKFTSTSSSSTAINANDANCAGIVFDNVTFAGSGSGPRLIGTTEQDVGCWNLLDSATSTTAGEEFAALSIVDIGAPNPNGVMSEAAFIKFDYASAPAAGLAQTFIYGNYVAFVGGEISHMNAHPSAEHAIRLPQWNYVVIDAMRLADQQYCRSNSLGCSGESGATAKSLITLRQDCGGTTSCPNSPSASVFSISRNYLLAYHDVANDRSGTDPIEMCTPGTGGSEQTKCYDGDLIDNVFTYEDGPGANPDQYVNLQGGGSAGAELKRLRFIGNMADLSSMTSTNSRFITIGGADDVAVIGNVIVDTDTASTARVMANGSTQLDVVKNNLCVDSGNLCDMFPAFAEDTSNNVEVTSDPFDRDGVAPGKYLTFDVPDVLITHASAIAGAGVVSARPTDVEGESIPQSSDYEPGVDDE